MQSLVMKRCSQCLGPSGSSIVIECFGMEMDSSLLEKFNHLTVQAEPQHKVFAAPKHQNT